MAERKPHTSTDFNWTEKERKSYIDGNYGHLTREDADIDSILIEGVVEYDAHTPIIGQFNTALELGVANVLRGPAFISPLVRDGGIIRITDVSENNVRATQKDMERIREGANLGVWNSHQEHMAQCHPAWKSAFGRAAILSTAYDTLDVALLEPDMADIVSLSYLIESKGHSDFSEWRRDLHSVARAAMRLIHIRQSDESEAYMVGDKIHLAVRVRREQTEDELDKLGFKVITSHTAAASGQARQDNDSHSYSGFSGIIAERV